MDLLATIMNMGGKKGNERREEKGFREIGEKIKGKRRIENDSKRRSKEKVEHRKEKEGTESNEDRGGIFGPAYQVGKHRL